MADRGNFRIPSTQVDVTPWRCTRCGKAVGKICHDDDGREYRECDCTKAARTKQKGKDNGLDKP